MQPMSIKNNEEYKGTFGKLVYSKWEYTSLGAAE